MEIKEHVAEVINEAKTGKAEDPVPCRYDGPYEQIKNRSCKLVTYYHLVDIISLTCLWKSGNLS